MYILRDEILTTRKKHRCCACGRVFEKGTRMRTQVVAYDGIGTWRECPTCEIILSKFGSEFYDESDRVYQESCVLNVLGKDETPEELLTKIAMNNGKRT